MSNNLIQIKRSLTTAIPASLANGELAYTANGDVLYIGSNGTIVAIGGKRNPGVLTANQALIANATSGIDKVIVANLVPTTVWANGASGTAGDVLTSNGTAVYWKAPSAGVAGSDTQVQFNDGGALAGDAGLTFNKTTDTLSTNTVLATSTVNAASHTVGTSTIANSTGVFTTGTVNGATISVGTSVVANSTRLVLGTAVGFQANGTIGTAGQVLHSNGTTVYWATDDDGVTSVSTGNGLTGGPITTTGTVSVLANNGIVANSSGVFAKQANGTSVDAGGINVVGGNGLVSNATGVHVGSGNGITVDADSIRVTAGTGVTVNATGVHIGQAVATTSNVTFANVVTSNLSVTGTVSSNLMPLANNTYHLGNTTLRWAQVHAANVHGSTGIFDGNVEIAGNLIVSGNVTTTNVGSLIVGDAKILLAANNPGDVLDIGFSGTYTDGGSTVRHAGLFRDASDNGVFKLFDNLTQNLTGNNTVDTANTTYRIATLNSYISSSGLSTNSSSVIITANSTVNVAITANTLTLSSPLAGTSGGTGKSTMTNNAILVGNSTNGYNELTLGTSGYVLQSNGVALIYDTLDGGTF